MFHPIPLLRTKLPHWTLLQPIATLYTTTTTVLLFLHIHSHLHPLHSCLIPNRFCNTHIHAHGPLFIIDLLLSLINLFSHITDNAFSIIKYNPDVHQIVYCRRYPVFVVYTVELCGHNPEEYDAEVTEPGLIGAVLGLHAFSIWSCRATISLETGACRIRRRKLFVNGRCWAFNRLEQANNVPQSNLWG